MDYQDDNKYNYYPGDEDLHRSRNKKSSGKRNSTRLEKRLKKNARKEKTHKFFNGVGIAVLIIGIILVIVGTGVGIGMYTAVSTEIADMNISDLALNYSSYIMYEDSDGTYKELEQIKSTVNRKWVSSDEIGDNLKEATIAIEDERFEKHHGVDLKRTFGATVKYLLSKIGIGDSSYGGSTITQQVIKNITNEKEKSPTRKIKEMMSAIALEKQLSKDEILTLYLNIVYFANGCYGVEAASNTYFNKSADELTLAEAASIVGITQTPAKFDPIANPENNIEKRNLVLAKMLELGKISQEEYDEAVSSSLKVVGHKTDTESNITSYFVDEVIKDVVKDLQDLKGYSEDFANQQITNGGLKIYSTIDPEIQEKIEKVFENTSNFPSSSAQSAMVIIDPYTGQIKGMVGGIGKKTDTRGFNRATQAVRQPGSAIKPLSVYAPAIELEKVTPATIVTDEKITIGSDNWEPSNSYRGFKGDMTICEAVGRSSNIPAVKVLDMVGINKSFSYLQNNFKFTTLESADKNYSSISLGGLTRGVTVEEITAAYATFLNGGKYIRPYTYTKVVDASGNTILENTPDTTQALKPSTAFVMKSLLRQPVYGSYGTARSARLSDITTYGKTGTTNDNIDKWFVGLTDYYAAAVWYGYDSPKAISASSNPAISVWKKVMEDVHSGFEEKEVEIPQGVVEAEICLDSGDLARSSCNSTTVCFLTGTQPKKTCSSHKSSSNSNRTQKPEDTDKPKSTENSSREPNSNDDDTDVPEKSQPPEGSGTGSNSQTRPEQNPDSGQESESNPVTEPESPQGNTGSGSQGAVPEKVSE